MSALITAEGLVRLDAALARIEEHPEEHHQGSWMKRRPWCGTTYCLAGTLALLAGAKPDWDPGDEESDADAYLVTRPDGGELVGVSDYAAELLGVDPEGHVVDELFYGASDLGDLLEIRDRLAASLELTP